YRGNTHNIRLGRLDYFGWRKLTATIPGFVPQSTRFALLDKNLHFVSLFVVSDVHEVGGQFYFYVDDLEVRADESDAKYPGSEIKDNW
ncbi:endoflagellar filament sheath protein, partial [Leptospira borgpetersenii serovar Ballum]|uniref:flagellar filament outer layer protein FlaA n=1 Tax=Leptospira borgpetersenii TaxID=174 RepID=UPI0019E39A6F